MRRYLSLLFVILSIITIIVGYRSDVRWNGIVTWGIVFILLSFAIYFTKYIPNK